MQKQQITFLSYSLKYPLHGLVSIGNKNRNDNVFVNVINELKVFFLSFFFSFI